MAVCYLTDGVRMLSSSFQKIESTENFKKHSSKYEVESISIESEDVFFKWLNSESSLSDNLSLSINVGSASVISFSSGDGAVFNENIELLNDALSSKDCDEKIILSILVRKSFLDLDSKTAISIYSLPDFSEHLSSLSIIELADFLPNECIAGEVIVFNVMHDHFEFGTQRFIFRKAYPSASTEIPRNVINTEERNLRIGNRDKCGHFANAASMNYLPEDFLLNTQSSDTNINSIFNGLFVFYLMVFLCDFSKVKDLLSVRLKGYKLVTQEFSFSELQDCRAKELFEIYSWTYGYGSFSDKIGLARNLISIHLKGENLLTLDEGTIHSIESGYDLYLKDNVKQYIEIKNKLSEFIQSSSDKANLITKSMFNSMKNSLWGFISFFISVIFLNVIGKGAFNGIINTDVLIISYGILTVSLFLLWVSRKETEADKIRFKISYSSLKDRYKDLLNENDLNRILQNEKIYNDDLDYIASRKGLYTYTWLGIALIMAIVVTSLWYFNPPKLDQEEGQNNPALPSVNTMLSDKNDVPLPAKSLRLSPNSAAQSRRSPLKIIGIDPAEAKKNSEAGKRGQ